MINIEKLKKKIPKEKLLEIFFLLKSSETYAKNNFFLSKNFLTVCREKIFFTIFFSS